LREARTVIQHHGSSVNSQRQSGPHAHFITPDPNDRFVMACDLGLDKVLVYKFEASQAALTPNEPPFASVKPGAGPRHLAFSSNGRFVYVINEMGSSITAFGYDPTTGVLKELQTVSSLPADFKGENSCAEIQMHPSGKFVYGSNRGHNSIACFGVDPTTGNLNLIGHQNTQGKTPRHFALDPSGHWLLAENQDSDSIRVFEVNATTGKLRATEKGIELGAPVCVVFSLDN
jgi:6-phosphogluconolactonase